jgi:hypothetical protein
MPASAGNAMPGAAPGVRPAPSRRRERATLWQDSMAFSDSFFTPDRSFDTGVGELRPLPPDVERERPAIVSDDPPPLRH